MAIPHFPWYDKVRGIVAPTEKATNVILCLIIIVCAYLLLRGSAGQKAAAVVWAVLP